MHELTIAMGVLDEVGEEALRQAVARVTVVHLRVGALSGVVPSALEFSWDLAAAGTVAEGSELAIQRVPLAVACGNCGQETEPAAGSGMRCAACGADTTTLIRGRELELIGMEVLDEDAFGRDPAQHPT
jgi:hydrogenase nickel incorporation protein HypA/HybF